MMRSTTFSRDSIRWLFAELLIIKSVEVAQTVVVAPVFYTLLIWGTMYGYLVFAELPDLWTWVGALLIVAIPLET